SRLMHALPPDFPASVFVVLHLMGTPLMLPPILSGPLHASVALDGERFARSRIYVAPAGSHMVLGRGLIRLTHTPREKGCRPAIDPLFRSAARVYGSCVVGVVLSGRLHDGSEGLAAIKEHGGVAVVQDPTDAKYGAMPTAAITSTHVDRVAPVERLASVLVELVDESPSAAPELLCEEA
ncbi:MAG: chemotaxis protein CheB, partial [Solirubrobacteraceae bacterium]